MVATASQESCRICHCHCPRPPFARCSDGNSVIPQIQIILQV